MNAPEFLQAELDHAERQLARVRRIQSKMQTHLTAAGLDEVAVYEKLATHQAYRQLQRDEIVFHHMWLRAHRQLARLPQTEQTKPASTFDQAFEEAYADILREPKPQPYRKPYTPGPNEKCLCGSGLKYKKCCGNPLKRTAPLAA